MLIEFIDNKHDDDNNILKTGKRYMVARDSVLLSSGRTIRIIAINRSAYDPNQEVQYIYEGGFPNGTFCRREQEILSSIMLEP
jgi:hypothetical protein